MARRYGIKQSDLAKRITLVMWLLSFVSTLASTFIVGSFLLLSHKKSIEEQLKNTARQLINMDISEFSDFQQPLELETFVEDALSMSQTQKMIRVFNPERQLIFSSLGFEYDDLPKQLGPYDEYRYHSLKGKKINYQAYVHPYKVNEAIYYLQTVTPLPNYKKMLQYFWWQILLIFLVLLMLSYIFSHWLANRLISPVKEVAHYLEKLDLNKLEDWRALKLLSPGDYLSTIILGINHLTTRVQKDIFRTRYMNRYVAHEMRTPLTILQGETETLLMKSNATQIEYQNLLKSSLEEISRLSETVDTVLSIEKISLEKESTIELISWLKEQKILWEKSLQRKLHFSYPKQQTLLIKTYPHLFFRLIDNLIRNVQKHTPAQSACYLKLDSYEKKVWLSIQDSGPGMEPEKLLLLNQNKNQFHLPSIGLNLCQSIADIIEAKFIFTNLQEGGLEVKIEMERLELLA